VNAYLQVDHIGGELLQLESAEQQHAQADDPSSTPDRQ